MVALMKFPPQGGCEVESEAVDMHVRDPVTERVHHHLERTRVTHVDRVAAAGDIDVVARVVFTEPVIRDVVDAAKGQHRSPLVTFRRVVVDDVENHLEAGLVQRLHHRLELADRVADRITRVRRKKADRVVAPVVPQPALDQCSLIDERVHRHQFDRRNAEPPQMLDGRWRRHRRIGAAQRRGDVGMTTREAAHVHLVDDGLVPGNGRRPIVVPCERRFDDAAFRHSACAVAAIE